jgi:hypothetical protein
LSTQGNIVFEEEIRLSNYFEYRLHQLSILLHAFEKEEAFTDEYQQLLDERSEILRQLDITGV